MQGFHLNTSQKLVKHCESKKNDLRCLFWLDTKKHMLYLQYHWYLKK